MNATEISPGVVNLSLGTMLLTSGTRSVAVSPSGTCSVVPALSRLDRRDIILARGRIGLHPHTLSRNPNVHVVRPHVLRRHGHRPDHRLFLYVHAREHSRVVRDANSVLEPGRRSRYIALIDDAVRVTVNVGEVADRHLVAE